MNPHDCGQGLVRDFGLAYVICMVNYLRVVMTHAPTGRSDTGSQVLAWIRRASRETILVAEDQRM